jgi:hypothetical protein
MPLPQKNDLMSKLFMKLNDTEEPEEEVVQDSMSLMFNIIDALRLIQKNDRGRQGRFRIMHIKRTIEQKVADDYKMEMRKRGLVQGLDDEKNEEKAIITV